MAIRDLSSEMGCSKESTNVAEADEEVGEWKLGKSQLVCVLEGKEGWFI